MVPLHADVFVINLRSVITAPIGRTTINDTSAAGVTSGCNLELLLLDKDVSAPSLFIWNGAYRSVSWFHGRLDHRREQSSQQ
jgi:hypothetical protein